MPKKIILLSGPTASGKSKLAIKLAKTINGEIINADSMQVYKEFAVLSSRPNLSEIVQAKHHLYGFVSVKDYFSAGEWINKAKSKIKSCVRKNKIPIVVGGTGLYFNTITKGMSKIPEIDFKIRSKVRNLFKKIGPTKFYESLLILDPKVENRIAPTDSQRSQRAYEVILKTKKSIFDWTNNTKSEFSEYDIKKVFLNIPRDELLNNISKRTFNMFKNDECINEVNRFNLLKANKSLSANKLIGIKEINNFLKGSISKNQCIELINIRTRQYAKRQNTWARGHMKNWIKLYSKEFPVLLKKTLKVVS